MEQYQVVDSNVISRPGHEISAESLQSPHDMECHYRKKNTQQVKGYSLNVTETCDTDDNLNLVTNVLVDTAVIADCDFLQPAIESTREIVTQEIKTANTDGAYHSVENQNYCNRNNIDLILGAIQGKQSRYDLTLDETCNLTVTDLQTGLTTPCHKIESDDDEGGPKWVIRDEKGRLRYFGQKEIDTCLIRRRIAGRSQSELNVRNNVEATIFQLCYHYPNNKSRYRGLSKHKIWANVRCLWINFVRILNFTSPANIDGLRKVKRKVKKQRTLSQLMPNFVKLGFSIAPAKKFRLSFSKNRLGAVFENDFL